MSAFDVNHLKVIAYAGGIAQWHYAAFRLRQRIADVQKTGFFNQAADMVNVGDMITIAAFDGVAIAYVLHTGDVVLAVVAPLLTIPAPIEGVS